MAIFFLALFHWGNSRGRMSSFQSDFPMEQTLTAVPPDLGLTVGWASGGEVEYTLGAVSVTTHSNDISTEDLDVVPETITKPRVFVGSSTESLEVAYAIQENLEFAAEVTVWTQGVFEVSRTTVQALMQAVDTFDFAVFVFAPEDIVKMRNDTLKTARDNVVFELGLFIGGLGEDRAFIIMPRGTDLHLPTDLAGITPATYEPNRRDNNLVAALGPACTRVKRAMEESGIRQSSTATGAIATPVAAGLSDELRQDVAAMLREQAGHIAAAFERFEKRVASMIETQRETVKAPISRLAYVIQKELSHDAQVLLKHLVEGGHLTRDQYDDLSATFGSSLEELRSHNLLVPLRGADKLGKEIPVYWLPPGTKRTIAPITKDLEVPATSETEAIRAALTKIGYC